jgi:hypothetical protein
MLVPVAPLREAFERNGLTSTEVARELGWYETTPKKVRLDTGRVRRTLGLRSEQTRANRGKGYRQHVRYETALKLARAMGVDPVDVGL